MGQRLVVTINKNDGHICKIYYHWSAYSHSALYKVRELVNCIYNSEDETENELLLRLIRFCEKNGGGIRADDKEFEYIQELYPNETFKKEDKIVNPSNPNGPNIINCPIATVKIISIVFTINPNQKRPWNFAV